LLKYNDKTRKIKLKELIIIYFPTLINLILFCFSDTITMNQYYNVYYILCVAYSIVLIYIWGIKKKNISNNSAIFMLTSFIASMIIGTISDRFVGFIDPQISFNYSYSIFIVHLCHHLD